MGQTIGKIAAILDRTTVVINRGSRDGVSQKDMFWIYSELGPFVDPDTNEDLGTTKKVWGKVVVTSVEERFCVAKTEYQARNFAVLAGLTSFFETTVEQVKLPVDESQIAKGLTKVEVGFKAFLEKHQENIIERKVEALPVKQAPLLKVGEEADLSDVPQEGDQSSEDISDLRRE